MKLDSIVGTRSVAEESDLHGPRTPSTGCLPTRQERRGLDLFAQAALVVCVLLYWYVLVTHTIRLVPSYSGELKAIAHADWITMWTWVDYGQYFRYSPTGLLSVGLIDRHILAPLCGVAFPSDGFTQAHRLVPVFIASFVLIAVCTYRLCRFLALGVAGSFAAGLFIGLNKGFAYYFHFVSTIAASLLILYSVAVLYFGIRYLRKGRPTDLVGYYLSLFLAVGAWEQWINLLCFLIAASIILAVRSGIEKTRSIIIHGILIPLLIGVVYLALHFSTISRESQSVSEAQSVFTYPSAALMIEDVMVNASLHVASIVEPLLFPWPMLSQSAITRNNIDAYNQYNKTYTPFFAIHYVGIGDWYAGLLFGVFLVSTACLAWYLARNRERALPASVGLMLTWAGFIVHLPIMYRTYFVLPGYASLLDYKHALSILGFSILTGWAIQQGLPHIHARVLKAIFFLSFVSWVAYCNYSKVATSFQFGWGVYP